MTSVSYSVDDAAFHDYALHVARRHPVFVRGRRNQVTNRAVLFAGLAAIAGSVAVGVGLMVAALGLLWCVLTWRTYPEKAAKEQVAIRTETRGSKRLETQNLTITDDSIVVSSAGSTGTFRWEAIEQWGQTARCVFFSVTPSNGIVIPKAALSDAQIEAIQSVAVARLGAPDKRLHATALGNAAREQ